MFCIIFGFINTNCIVLFDYITIVKLEEILFLQIVIFHRTVPENIIAHPIEGQAKT